jgi:hypothetical protein
MPAKIKPKRSYTANAVPTTSDLETNELAINWADSKAFTKNGAGQIVSVTLGGGGASTEDSVLRALFVPPAPTGLTATPGNGQATLSWTAPTGVIAQAPVNDYREQFSSDNGATWTTFTAAASTATSATVTGLTNGTAYVFRVAAVNAVGTGSYSTASAAVTPSVPSDANFASVSLLMHMDGSGSTFTDSSATPKTITANGNATQSATQSKWGGKSLYISSASDYLSFASSADLSFGTGDFVIEGWVYLTSVTAYQFLLGQNQDSGGYMMVAFNYDGNTGTIAMGRSSIGWPVVFSGHGMSANTWNYIAISRTGSTNRCYVNGSKIGSDVTDSTNWQSNVMRVGNHIGVQSLVGYIDDLRLTKGANRSYTGATITVPTAAFPTAGPMSAPTSLSATGGNAQVSLTWTAPSYNGGSSITDYSVQFSTNSGSTWTNVSRTASTTASQVVTGLTNGTSYVFRVAGINANGTGTYTAASSSVTPFTPTSVAGLQLWLDASDAGSLFDATPGGSLVAADGAVARWQDKSGNSRHLTQSTSGSRPTRKTAVQNGLSVVRFDGSNDFMSVPSSTAAFKFLHSTAHTLFFVARARTLNTRETLFDTGTLGSSSGDDGSSGATLMLFTNGAALHRIQSGASPEVSNSLAASSFVAGSSYLLSVVANPTATTAANRSEVRINGGAAIKNNAQIDSVATGDSRQNLTIGQVIGYNGDGSLDYEEYADLDFCEIVMYNAALSDAERAAVEQYLISKWAIT